MKRHSQRDKSMLEVTQNGPKKTIPKEKQAWFRKESQTLLKYGLPPLASEVPNWRPEAPGPDNPLGQASGLVYLQQARDLVLVRQKP